MSEWVWKGVGKGMGEGRGGEGRGAYPTCSGCVSCRPLAVGLDLYQHFGFCCDAVVCLRSSRYVDFWNVPVIHAHVRGCDCDSGFGALCFCSGIEPSRRGLSVVTPLLRGCILNFEDFTIAKREIDDLLF